MLVVFWDLDGTLVSSELVYRDVFYNYLKKKNVILREVDNDKLYFSKFSGRHPSTFLEVLKEDGYLDKNFSFSEDEINSIFEKELKEGKNLILTNYIEKPLEFLYENKVPMAIVTSTFKEDFHNKYNSEVFEKIRKYFDDTYICGEIGNCSLKPNADCYLTAFDEFIKKHSLQNEEFHLVIVEDSISGCASASSFKNIILKNNLKIEVTTVGLIGNNRFMTGYDLKKYGVDIVFEDAKGLLDFFKAII